MLMPRSPAPKSRTVSVATSRPANAAPRSTSAPTVAANAMISASASRGRCTATNTAASGPRPDQHRTEHPAGPERHPVADQRRDDCDDECDRGEHHRRGRARRPRWALAYVVADARELQGFHVVEAGDHVTPIVGRRPGACGQHAQRRERRRRR